MEDYTEDLINLATTNSYFREVIETGQKMQVVVMSLKPGEDIGSEVHENNEQLLIAIGGQGKVVLGDQEGPFNEGDLVIVKAGTRHNFINTGANEMKILTIYSPPHHEDGTVHQTKLEAEAAEANEPIS